MAAPARRCEGFGKHDVVLKLISALGLTEELVGFGLNNKVWFIAVICAKADLENPSARFELFDNGGILFE